MGDPFVPKPNTPEMTYSSFASVVAEGNVTFQRRSRNRSSHSCRSVSRKTMGNTKIAMAAPTQTRKMKSIILYVLCRKCVYAYVWRKSRIRGCLPLEDGLTDGFIVRAIVLEVFRYGSKSASIVFQFLRHA